MSGTAGSSLQTYLRAIERALKRGDASEHTHRPALTRLLEELLPGAAVVNEPRRIDCGAPDFMIGRGQVPLGYVEAKDVGDDLDRAERSEQLKRYRDSLGNLILTNHLEFRWYVDGERRLAAKIAHRDGLKSAPNQSGIEDLQSLIAHFREAQAPIIGQAKELARRMAALTRLLKASVLAALAEERKKAAERKSATTGFPLHGQLAAFREVLLPDLAEDDFADMHAQTVAYGLFAARMNKKRDEQFTWKTAQSMLPRNNPFLAKTFVRIWVELDEALTWAIEDLAELLNRTDMDAILAQFRGPTRRGDPIVHFYETFLAEYDPDTREARGVYYTPGPAVSYMVRSVDDLLKDAFALVQGLADSSMAGEASHRVQILDPACGTGTFLHAVIDHVRHATFATNQGLWRSHVRQHLLPRLFGFELLMAPYAVAHMKLGLLLEETEAKLESGERINVFLTNCLEDPHPLERPALFTQWLTQEAEAASSVKRQSPIMVIIGNPPYSERSINPSQRNVPIVKGAAYEDYKGRVPRSRVARKDIKAIEQRTLIGHLLRGWDPIGKRETASYFHVDGKALGEANPKALHNDYVKFFRFAQWRIDRTGSGIIAFVTDNVFMEGPIFRAMRKALMEDFAEIYVLDLHGSTLEPAPADDGPDENVFAITLGVCITVLVKYPPGRRRDRAGIYRAGLTGPLRRRDGTGKFDWLSSNSLATTAWERIVPAAPDFAFARRRGGEGEWHHWLSLPDLFRFRTQGLKTHRDHFAVGFTRGELEQRLRDFTGDASDAEIRQRYTLEDNRDWHLHRARAAARQEEALDAAIRRCLYRPFDQRLCIHSPIVMDRPRFEVFDPALLGRNLFLGVGRQGKAVSDPVWNLVTISCQPIDTNAFRRGGVTVFATLASRSGLFNEGNSPPSNLVDIDGWHGADLPAYLYAILHAPSYRRRYADFLRSEFPRIPLTTDVALRRKLIAAGGALIDAHLLRVPGPAQPDFPAAGSNRVELVRYEAPTRDHRGIVQINPHQFFAGVPAAVWEFRIGGYQVAEKWLKDRRGRELDHEDLQRYRHIIAALAETIRLMEELDRTIDTHGGWPLAGSLPAPAFAMLPA